MKFLFGFSFLYTSLIAFSNAQVKDDSLVGTWTSKSKSVFTGPAFYNPVKDQITEPDHTGISYSFTGNGYYESSLYQAVSNRKILSWAVKPECPSAIIQWQHGKYSIQTNGSLQLKPFEVDGRQILSRPCANDEATYTRYSQPELFERYEVITDPFHNVQRLNIFQFDGTPLQPLYLAYSPPQMLPTITLNPTASPTGSGSKSTDKAKRSILDDNMDEGSLERREPMNKHSILKPREPIDADRWWWAGVGLTATGTMLYLYSKF